MHSKDDPRPDHQTSLTLNEDFPLKPVDVHVRTKDVLNVIEIKIQTMIIYCSSGPRKGGGMLIIKVGQNLKSC